MQDDVRIMMCDARQRKTIKVQKYIRQQQIETFYTLIFNNSDCYQTIFI